MVPNTDPLYGKETEAAWTTSAMSVNICFTLLEVLIQFALIRQFLVWRLEVNSS